MCKALAFFVFAGLALATVAATTDDVEVKRKYPFVTRKLRQFGWGDIDWSGMDWSFLDTPSSGSGGGGGAEIITSTTPRGDGGTEIITSTTPRQGVYEAGGGGDSDGNTWGYERNPDGSGSDWFVSGGD